MVYWGCMGAAWALALVLHGIASLVTGVAGQVEWQMGLALALAPWLVVEVAAHAKHTDKVSQQTRTHGQKNRCKLPKILVIPCLNFLKSQCKALLLKLLKINILLIPLYRLQHHIHKCLQDVSKWETEGCYISEFIHHFNLSTDLALQTERWIPNIGNTVV